jgi:hypothetical protein
MLLRFRNESLPIRQDPRLRSLMYLPCARMQVVSVLRDQQVLLARVEREAQASREREQAALEIMGNLKQEVGDVKRVLIAMLSGQSSTPTSPVSPSETSARFSPASSREHRRVPPGFFERPPSAPVAAATEAALRAAAAHAAHPKGAETGDPAAGGGGQSSTEQDQGRSTQQDQGPESATAENIVLEEGREQPAKESGAREEGQSNEEGSPETAEEPEGENSKQSVESGFEEQIGSGGVEEETRESGGCCSNEEGADLTAAEGDSRDGQAAEKLGPGDEPMEPHNEQNDTVVPQWAMEYTIGRNYQSVADYWREWAHGKPGCSMALREIERQFGTRWRKDRPNESKFLSKFRKVTEIVETVLRRNPNLSEEAAVSAVEQSMVASGIDKYQV